MAPEKKNRFKDYGIGLLMGLALYVGKETIGNINVGETMEEVKQEIKEMRKDVIDIKLNYVEKRKYEKDKELLLKLYSERK